MTSRIKTDIRQLKKKGSLLRGLTIVFMALVLAASGLGTATTYAASVNQVSTGALTACAVSGGKVKCWGDNSYGQLGNRSTANSSTPVSVYAVKDPAPVAPSPCGGWFQPSCTPVAQPSSPLGGKYVEKVSVGTTHACALADAKVYCWGDNSHGQLGNNSNTNSSMPVAVSTNKTAVPAGPEVCKSSFFGVCTSKGPSTPAVPASAVSQKEIVDIATGEYFTCALASDGTVSCWGEGDLGRLGTNSTADTNYPKAVYTGGTLSGKKGIKLAKVGGATMCVLTVDANNHDAPTTGSPYCWGWGIDDGTQLPPDGTSTVACGKNSPTWKPTAANVVTETTIFESKQPVAIPGNTFSTITGEDYMTALDGNGRAYYWGMYGYTATTSSFTNVKSCVVNTCLSSNVSNSKITLASISTDRARANNAPGGDKNRNLNSNNTSLQSAQNAASGGISSSIHSSGGNLIVSGNLNSTASYSSSVAVNVSGNNVNITSYRGVARPSGTSSQTSNVGDNNGPCGNQTHYGFTKNTVSAYTGKKAATSPPSWPQTQSGISAVSGNAYNGLACAKTPSGAFCDTHGTSANEGQTGSNYTKQCTTTGFIFTTTTCTPGPTGPQPIYTAGWLAGKSINTLDTGASGYTCAIANGGVGCWGSNTYGQLGNGTTANKNVPTAVSGLQ